MSVDPPRDHHRTWWAWVNRLEPIPGTGSRRRGAAVRGASGPRARARSGRGRGPCPPRPPPPSRSAPCRRVVSPSRQRSRHHPPARIRARRRRRDRSRLRCPLPLRSAPRPERARPPSPGLRWGPTPLAPSTASRARRRAAPRLRACPPHPAWRGRAPPDARSSVSAPHPPPRESGPPDTGFAPRPQATTAGTGNARCPASPPGAAGSPGHPATGSLPRRRAVPMAATHVRCLSWRSERAPPPCPCRRFRRRTPRRSTATMGEPAPRPTSAEPSSR
jgi:hypothetical protein